MPKGYKRANGTGGVVKLSGRRTHPYQARVTTGFKENEINGKVYQTFYTVGYFRTRAEAIKALEAFNGLRTNVEYYDMTMNDVMEYWKKHNTLSLNSIRKINSAFKQMQSLHDEYYRDITIAEVDKILEGYSVGAHSSAKFLFGALDRTAKRLEIPIKNVGEFIIIPEMETHAIKEPLSENDIDILWGHAEDPVVQIALIMVYSGWRITELFTLKKDNIDFAAKTMKGGIKTKAGKNRIIPIHDRIMPFIKSFYDTSKTDVLINININSYRNYIGDMSVKILNRHLSAHECRHTFETRLDNAGVSLVIRNKLQGHSNNNIGDDVYNHKTLDQLREAIDKLR